MQEIVPRAFAGQSGRWVPRPGAATPAELESLTVVTLKAWFEPHHAIERQRGLVDLLEGTDFDVACLQEVVPKLRDRLAASERVREFVAGYGIDERYGVLILSRLPVHRGWEVPVR